MKKASVVVVFWFVLVGGMLMYFEYSVYQMDQALVSIEKEIKRLEMKHKQK